MDIVQLAFFSIYFNKMVFIISFHKVDYQVFESILSYSVSYEERNDNIKLFNQKQKRVMLYSWRYIGEDAYILNRWYFMNIYVIRSFLILRDEWNYFNHKGDREWLTGNYLLISNSKRCLCYNISLHRNTHYNLIIYKNE